ncbi:hypothetical protein CXF68_09295 [Tenacibaculum sp. Bg11-29]|uniref:hypothetical protein n=1 Tax=Tenacibaculum sp. Bg11-29 TaxID=2058306 RepID=UPI000C337FD1|nr:hypothetical protein [Tenacibaculum sp. Bg11-29]PKH50869.1 hypothetical protein CXF68_09295 [Tenacibaculum sp. Bg11-29]
MKNVIHLLIIVFLCSCSVTKDFTKDKKSTDIKKDVRTQTTKVTEEKRPGGILEAPITPLDERPRTDSGELKAFIQKYKDGGLTKTVYYKPDGSVDVKCLADEVFRRIEEQTNIQDSSEIAIDEKNKTKKKEEKIMPEILLYIVLGMVLVFFIMTFFMYKTLNQNKAILKAILIK